MSKLIQLETDQYRGEERVEQYVLENQEALRQEHSDDVLAYDVTDLDDIKVVASACDYNELFKSLRGRAMKRDIIVGTIEKFLSPLSGGDVPGVHQI